MPVYIDHTDDAAPGMGHDRVLAIRRYQDVVDTTGNVDLAQHMPGRSVYEVQGPDAL